MFLGPGYGICQDALCTLGPPYQQYLKVNNIEENGSSETYKIKKL